MFTLVFNLYNIYLPTETLEESMKMGHKIHSEGVKHTNKQKRQTQIKLSIALTTR